MQSNAAPLAASDGAITLVEGRSGTARSREAARMAAHAGTAQTGTVQTGTGPDARQFDGDRAGPETVITVSGLVKRYGEVEAVRGIDFTVARGETFGFLGPNRAGKSTTIKILCTLANATAGTAMVAGHNAATERDAVRRNIGWCSRTRPWTPI